MKRSGAPALLVVVLFFVAVGLGIANKIRSDRRAARIAENLTPRGSNAYDKRDPTSADVSRPKATLSKPESADDSNRLDVTELTQAVLAGDSKAVQATRGRPSAEDAAAIYRLVMSIPPNTSDRDRPGIRSFLLHLLQTAPGEEASKLLMTMITTEGLLDLGDWRTTALALGNRGYREADSYFEGLAFSPYRDSGTEKEWVRSVGSATSLLLLDAGTYLPQIGDKIKTCPDSELPPFVTALRIALEDHSVNIASVLPALQGRFKTLTGTPAQSAQRLLIAEALEANAQVTKSGDARAWLLSELRLLIDAEWLDGDELDSYRNMLNRLSRN